MLSFIAVSSAVVPRKSHRGCILYQASPIAQGGLTIDRTAAAPAARPCRKRTGRRVGGATRLLHAPASGLRTSKGIVSEVPSRKRNVIGICFADSIGRNGFISIR